MVTLDLRPVFLVIGLLLAMVAVAMLVPAAVDFAADNPDWLVFAASAGTTFFFGAAIVLASRSGRVRPSLRQVYLMTTGGWVAVAAAAALPFAFSGLDMGATDALFESVSGITTTGATNIANLERAPPGILVWRALLQWLGGIGVIVMAMVVLPVLRIGGMQIFRIEGAGPAEKVMPRAARMTSAVALLYLLLTAGLGVALWLTGLTGFDAALHAMTTIATGGFSTLEASVSAFANPAAETVILVGMVLGGMPFVLLLYALRGHLAWAARDTQLRWYLGLLALASAMMGLWMWTGLDIPFVDALRRGAFVAVSTMTGTGFAIADYAEWRGLPIAAMFFLMLVGGCAGSTTAGVKVFRVHILLASARVQVARLLGAHAVLIPYYNRKPIPDTVADTVMGFLFVFALTFAVLAMGLGMTGFDFRTAITAAAAAIANAGPGLGDAVGPFANYVGIPDAAKWLLMAGMLLGRLEMFLVLVLFLPTFWRS